MGVTQSTKPISLLGLINFDLQNLPWQLLGNISSDPIVALVLHHLEPLKRL